MTSRTWFWKVAVSVLALAVAVYEFYPLSPTPLEEFIPTQVIKDQPAFEKIHAEAKKRFRDYKDAAVPADQKSVSYYQALRDIGEGKGRPSGVDLLPFFYRAEDFVREPDQSKRNILVLKQQLLASQGKLKLGLDLQGGVAFTLKVDPSGVESGEKSNGDKTSMAPAQMVAQAITVMEQRVNAFGVAEPVIRPVGDLSLEIQLPGEDAANNPDIMDALKKPAKLEFRQVYRGERPAPTDRERSTKALQDDSGAIATYEVLTERNVDRRTGEVTTQRYYVRKKADATGKMIKSSAARSDDGLSFYVSMTFTDVRRSSAT